MKNNNQIQFALNEHEPIVTFYSILILASAMMNSYFQRFSFEQNVQTKPLGYCNTESSM